MNSKILNLIVCISLISLSLSADLIGYWRLDGTTGSTALDSSENSRNGVLTNMDNSDWIAGRWGNALDFDGVNDVVLVQPGIDYNGIPYASVQVWFKTNYLVGQYNYGTFAWNNSNNEGGITMGISPANTFYICYRDNLWTSGNYPQLHGTKVINDGLWHQAVFIYDSIGAKLYIDGVLENSTARGSQLSNIPNEEIHIGHLANQLVGNYHFKGAIDEVAIWNRGLSATEVQSLYNSNTVIPEQSAIISFLTGLILFLWKKNVHLNNL